MEVYAKNRFILTWVKAPIEPIITDPREAISKKGWNKKTIFEKILIINLNKNKIKVNFITTAYIKVTGVHHPSKISAIHQWKGNRANFINKLKINVIQR